MTIIIINNYTEEKDAARVKKIEEALRREGKDKVVIWHFSEIKSKESPENLEAIILSGSRAHLQNNGVYSEYYDEVNLITKADVPILGICFGHQLIGKAFGANIKSLPKFLNDFQNIKIIEPNEIFKPWKIGDELCVYQSHKDFVEKVPPNFILLAESGSCKVEAMKHKTKPIYGIQAHIERATNEKPDGHQIIRNFLKHVVETSAPRPHRRSG
ncbi:MAG: gamma-glutamyl-gamma-aminobutyrate hydrolase family protein [Candidatus Bathyarchaeia archaeon]